MTMKGSPKALAPDENLSCHVHFSAKECQASPCQCCEGLLLPQAGCQVGKRRGSEFGPSVGC
eukprot:161072-Prymnesium_polylepis.1